MSKKRKQNGEGSVFQVSENKWVAKIYLGTRIDGKPNIKQFSGKTESIVKKKLREFKKSNDYIKKHIPNNDTVISYFSTWLKDYKYNKLKPLSYDRLESTITNHIYPNIGGLKMDKVTRNHIQNLINQLYKKQNLSYSSVKKVYMALNACYKHALIDNVVLKNPCVGIELPCPAEHTKQITAFTLEEIERFKTEITKTNECGEPCFYYGYAFSLILNTGLRIAEALSLCWDDIDFEKKTITVNKNKILAKKRDNKGDKIGGYELLFQDSTKTINSNRIIPINKSAETALYSLKKNNDTNFVIVNQRQNQTLPSNFERAFHRVLKKANIKACGLHVLRHTFASMLFSKGVDVKIVSKLLGHSTVKITYDIYVHLFEQDLSNVTNVLD